MSQLLATIRAACLLIATMSCTVFGQGVALKTITQEQSGVLAAYLRHEVPLQRKIDFAYVLAHFPQSNAGDLDPSIGTTGVHCVLPNKDESLHAVQYLVGNGSSARRVVFAFTFSPPVPPGGGGSDIAALLRSRSVTQYWVWRAGADPQGSGKVYAFSSRADSGICEHL